MKASPSIQKMRGGYYTPSDIADFIARWAIVSRDSTVLEPSCGDGALLESAINVLRELGASDSSIATQIHAVEVDVAEATKASERMRSIGVPDATNQIHVGDFFAYCRDDLMEDWLAGPLSATTNGREKRYSAVIGNPPFIRYQNFQESSRSVAFQIMLRTGLHPNKLMNSWLPFLIASTLLLEERGRLAMVIPAELFQVHYAAEARQFLSDHFKRITIITFKKLVFDDLLQEVVLLLCERNGSSEQGIRVVELNGIMDLSALDPNAISSVELKPIDHSTDKWTQYYLETSEILLLRALRDSPEIKLANHLMDVDVGVVTGENSFFAITDERVKHFSLESFARPMVTRTSHLEGLIFTSKDWQANVDKGLPAYLLQLPGVPAENLPSTVRQYLDMGKDQGIPDQYKCRIRKHWYVVPSVWCPDGFILRQVHAFPKLVINQANATSTDTIHRVKLRSGVDGTQVARAFLNSLTFSFSEVVGRSYGGGVLTFEPSESEMLPIPLRGADRLDTHRIDRLLRDGSIEKILDDADQILLIDGLGLDKKEVGMLRNIWVKLRNRRMNRK